MCEVDSSNFDLGDTTSDRRPHGNNRIMASTNLWIIFPYSPDLAPSDFSLFPEIKRQLKAAAFKTQEICAVTEEWLLVNHPTSTSKEF